MKKILLLSLIICNLSILKAQNIGIGTNTPDASALLDVKSSSKGLLIPRVALLNNTDIVTIVSPATSLIVYNTASAGAGAAAITPGFYFWSGSKWTAFGATASVVGGWSLTGNNGTNAATNFLGTTDNLPLKFRVNNIAAGE